MNILAYAGDEVGHGDVRSHHFRIASLGELTRDSVLLACVPDIPAGVPPRRLEPASDVAGHVCGDDKLQCEEELPLEHQRSTFIQHASGAK